jgi:N-formylglutamate amidohydrolase
MKTRGMGRVGHEGGMTRSSATRDARGHRVILPPAGIAATPWVFASPHSGDQRPDDMRPAPRLGRRSLRSAEDALVDRLIGDAAGRGAAVLLGEVSRTYVDLNRAPDELDPLLGDTPVVGGVSPRAAAGYGIVPRLTGDGRPVYARRLDPGETEARVARFHTPYHAALTGLMQAARTRHGRAILVDWHSMPPPRGQNRPRVVIGDRHGEACPPGLSGRLKTLFEAQGWETALNDPYAGGWSTQVWGRPAEGWLAVQIELDRSLYLDPASLGPGPGYDDSRARIARVIAALLDGPAI